MRWIVIAWSIPLLAGPVPDSPPLSRFHVELVRNFRGLVRTENLAPLFVGMVASGMAAPHDRDVQDFFGRTRRLREFGDVGQVAGGLFFSGAGAGGLLVAGRIGGGPRFRAMTYSLAQASVMSLVLASTAKATVRRERPNGQDTRSFYSGHASTAFTWAAVLHRYYGAKASLPAYVLAALISVSRLEKSQHHLSDVTAGAAAGYIIGSTVTRGRVRLAVSGLPGGGVRVSVGPARGWRGGWGK